MWKLEQEELYLRIYDSKKQIAGYFDPDYGEIFPKEKQDEIIEAMWKNHDKISGGFLMIGLAKFGIFGGDYNSDVYGLEQQIDMVRGRISAWKNYIASEQIKIHFVNISHTDQDMLTIMFPIRFSEPTPLHHDEIRDRLEPVLDRLQQQGLV